MVGLYAIAMAYVEAAVVVDLNGALGQRIGQLPAAGSAGALAAEPLVRIEAGREIATLVMIAAFAWLVGRTALERLAWGAIAFGAWDIAYYGWLRLFTGWPPALETQDILFLVPLVWSSPIWAPLSVSLALVVFGALVTRRLRAGRPVWLRARHVLAGLAGGLLVLASFVLDGQRAIAGGPSGSYPWPVFLAGMVLALGAAADALWGPSARAPVDAATG